MEIIDSHVHIGRWPRLDLSMTLSDLDQVMKHYHYTGAVVIPPLVARGDPVPSNLALQDQVAKRSDLYFFAWIHVKEDRSNELSLLEYLESNLTAIDGLKFHASISQTGIADERLSNVLAFADRHALPLLYHCGRHPISSAVPIKGMGPSFPHIRFIVGHLGGHPHDIGVGTMKGLHNGVPHNVVGDT